MSFIPVLPPAQESLAKYGALSGVPSASQPAARPVIASQPPSAIPPHMQAQMPPPRGGTPTYPSHAAGSAGGYPPQGYPGGTPPAGPSRGYGTPPPSQVPGFGTPPHVPHAPAQPPHAPGLAHAQPPPHTQLPPMSQPAPAAGPAAPQLPDALAGLPEDQKACFMFSSSCVAPLIAPCLGTHYEGHCNDKGGSIPNATSRPRKYHQIG